MELKELLKRIESPDFQKKIVTAAFSIMSGKDSETAEQQVTIKLPKEFLELINLIATETGVPLDIVLSQMAYNGILRQFQEAFGQGIFKQQTEPDEAIHLLSREGVDVGTLVQKLEQLSDLAKQLGNMQKVAQNVAEGITTRNSPEDKKNTEESDVSPGQDTKREIRNGK